MNPFGTMESHSKYQLQAKETGKYMLSNLNISEILFFSKATKDVWSLQDKLWKWHQ